MTVPRRGAAYAGTMQTRIVTLAAVLLTAALPLAAQTDCPMHSTADHHDGVMARGAKGMGFDQKTTTHHFVLLPAGGRIEVTANHGADGAGVDAIRMHLKHIAAAFAEGDFSLPMFIHDQTPPGVEAMKRLRKTITWRYEEIPNGARVAIATSNTEALAAVHDFLRFQIHDHETGDPLEVQANR